MRVAYPPHHAQDFRVLDFQQGFFEPLHRPAQAFQQEFDARFLFLDGNRFFEKLAGSVAVGRAGFLQQLAEQRAVVRLVGLHLAQDFPGLRISRIGIEVDDERLGTGALRFEHPIQEFSGRDALH
jgi:hypothetical protein